MLGIFVYYTIDILLTENTKLSEIEIRVTYFCTHRSRSAVHSLGRTNIVSHVISSNPISNRKV